MDYQSAVSVRNIVEFILRRGDIDSKSTSSSNDMVIGTRIHKSIQKHEEKLGGYRSEVRLSGIFDFGDISVKVQGIADGIIEREGLPVIDEIKSTTYPIDEIDDEFEFLHRAQADFYGYFYCVDNSINEIVTRLTYVDVETNEKRYIEKHRTFEYLREFTYGICEKYAVWARMQAEHIALRDNSIGELKFPFDSFRPGQREAAAHIYSAITNSQTLFVQAPTGIGKTVSSVFPALKTLGEHKTEKIFYLTSKNTIKLAAHKLYSDMINNGLDVKVISITAKEKICKYEKHCTPDKCPFAKGHYDRINDAVFDAVTTEKIFDADVIYKYAEKHSVCPFELSLDISNWCDSIICDVNYAFDPRASLKRYFEVGGDYVLLCDEAHNLVERAREMYSASISKKSVLEANRVMAKANAKCSKSLKKINKLLLEYRKKGVEDGTDNYSVESPDELYHDVLGFCDSFSAFLTEEGYEDEKNEVLQLFFDSMSFVSVFEGKGEEYRFFVSLENDDTVVKLFCIDPSRLLTETRNKCRSVIYFSATLLPNEYYENMLCGEYDLNRKFIRLPSPFPHENQLISIFSNVSTRYKDRESSVEKIIDVIGASAVRKGNFFVFFPSFSYMESVYDKFRLKYPNVNTAIQTSGMSQEERDGFLNGFVENPEDTFIGFAVLGGLFSEGIDLVGSRLSGVIVIGTGLPQVCFERDLIKSYFDSVNSKGFLYSYKYPGFNRVLQAAGRVIRTETDKGFIILVDDRYKESEYRALFPPEWFADDFEFIYTVKALEKKIDEFNI